MLAFGLLAYMPVDTAHADGNGRAGVHGGKRGGLERIRRARGNHGGPRLGASNAAVPELDPTAAAGALTLLAGGALMLGGARRRRA